MNREITTPSKTESALLLRSHSLKHMCDRTSNSSSKAAMAFRTTMDILLTKDLTTKATMNIVATNLVVARFLLLNQAFSRTSGRSPRRPTS